MSGRNLYEVLQQLETIVPEVERHWIRSCANTLLYRAPERLGESWNEVQCRLFVAIGLHGAPPFVVPYGEGWKAEALALWLGKSLDEMGDLLAYEEAAK